MAVSTKVVISLLVTLFVSFSTAAKIRRSILKPVITTDFPDPSIIKVDNTWYAFGSQSAFDYKNIKIQLATSPDFKTWTVTGKDVLASLPSWVHPTDPAIWAPSIIRLPSGLFLLYFSATIASNPLFHCVGAALSANISGPFVPTSANPLFCDLSQGGSIDASHFLDSDGKMYALYKIDANSMGKGGVCNNGVEPIKSTPIMIQQVSAEDGTTKIGKAVQLITNSELDGPLVEAPYMIKTAAGKYVLFFSSNCYTTAEYDVSYATSSSVMGPFVKTTTPLFVTGTQGLIGPGGASVLPGGQMAFHGYAKEEDVGKVRSMYVTNVKFQGGKVKAA